MGGKSVRWKYKYSLFGALLLLCLYLTTLYNYLLFHSLAELFSIVVAFGIFMVAWNSRGFADNDYLLFMGIAFLFIGSLDLLHTLSYTGMGVFPDYGTNLPTQIWISTRYIESISLLIAPLLIGRKLRAWLLIFAYTLVSLLLLGSIFYLGIFPDCFVEGAGLTHFKKISEYIICLILLGSIIPLLRKRREFDLTVLRLLIASIILTIASELLFTFYVHAYGISNLIGHFLKIASFYLIYKALIEIGLLEPYSLLFRNLRQSEDALRVERDRAEKYLSVAGVMLVAIDADQKVSLINRKGCELLECEEKMIIGKNWFDNFVPEGIREAVRGTYKKLIAGEIKPIEHYENAILTESGKERIIAWHNTILTDDEGSIVGTLSSGEDVTEIRAEEARKIAERELEKQRVLSMRSDRLRSLGEMAAGMAHELNQPLQGVRGMAEHLLISINRGWELTNEKIKDRMQIVMDQADRMVHIIEHVRIFAREAGKPELRAVQVNEVVRSGMDMLRSQFRDRGIEMDYDLMDSLPLVSVNPFSLEEVIINLLVNARDAVEEHINLGSLTPPRVFVRTKLVQTGSETSIEITIIDSGMGIPEHIIEKVFDPFFTTKDPDKGTGLGLSISKTIIEDFGGTIQIHSEQADGTTVTILLPVT